VSERKIEEQIEELKEDLMTALDDALAALNAKVDKLITDVEAKLAADGGAATDQAALDAVTALTGKLDALDAKVTPPVVSTALTVPDQVLSFALGQVASFQVHTDGGTPPVTFTVADLGDGLSVDGAGLVTGTPGTTGTTTVSVGAGDSTGATASGTLTVTVS